MKRGAAALVVVASSACGTPVPQIHITYSGGNEQQCADDCSKIPLPCDAVMSIRIVEPDDPDNPASRHLSQCERVNRDKNFDACSLNATNLDPVPLPVKDLEVQIAVFPGADLAIDPDTNGPICPDVRYSAANGFPIEYDVVPALGGRAYYHPGDQIVNVVLGCTDQSAPRAGVACTNPVDGQLTATVEDFDSRVPVSVGPGGVADHLFVSVGEPHSFDGGFVFNPGDGILLKLADHEIPEWSAPSDQKFAKYACVEVLEDVPQAVATLRCTQASDPLPRLQGMRIIKNRLTTILGSIGVPASEFPPEGITIGVVVDTQSVGVENFVVSATPGSVGVPGGTVTYMSTMDGDPPINMTSKNGIFISRDAPFGTIFSAHGQSGSLQMAPAVGGLVAGKVTVVVIQPMIGASQ
ncbi:MAG TPA: hypothetical protein VIX73_12960 [Kofleriaceae bacterium]